MSDARSTFALPDIAHIDLRGRVPARRFAAGSLHRVTASIANVYKDAGTTALERQVLHGNQVRVLPTDDGDRVFGRDEASGYVGFFDRDALGAQCEPTHRITARRTFAFPRPDIKAPVALALHMGACVEIVSRQGEFAQTSGTLFVYAHHLAPLGQTSQDWVSCAEDCLGAPYLWGGNSTDGLDCSGLVSLALTMAGLTCPGDSDQQESTLGAALPPGAPIQRGDLIFWRGHVALAVDAERLIHANAHHMAVAYEGIAEARKRINDQGGGPVTSHKRLRPSPHPQT